MPPEVPVATYRLQFSKAFGFEAAAKLVPYLKALGISHLYASPLLKARPGSAHGYDIVDHNALSPELGGDAGFTTLSRVLAEADLGLILDFVPNHVGIGGAENAWWLDVLEWGLASRHAASFDIDWKAPAARNRVLLPVLGKPYGEALEASEIVVKFASPDGTFSAWYYHHRFPIRPDLYPELIRTALKAAGAEDSPAGRRLLDFLLEHPARDPDGAQATKHRLRACPEIAQALERGLAAYRPKQGDLATVRALHHLLERQHYRVAHWRLASTDINYRRFFDINDLVGLRVEDRATFAAMHALVADLIRQRRLHGLRLDHIDGLADPFAYCRSLQDLITKARGASKIPFYLVVEKILEPGEPMPDFPGVEGTTGYEWLNVIARVLLAPGGLEILDRYRRGIPGNAAGFHEILLESKRTVLENLFGSEFATLVRLLSRIAAGHWQTRDYSQARIERVLKLYLLHFPVYRTYVGPGGASPTDRSMISRAIDAARSHGRGPDTIFDFLQNALTLDLVASKNSGYSTRRVREFVKKVQQLTGPLMAKALEDTACYRYLRLLALNEVGGDPAAGALEVAAFHRAMTQRVRDFPLGMTATATHDTKRGEDARVRLLALSELAEEWVVLVERSRANNARFVGGTPDRPAPSPGHEYLMYQALLGAWPLGGPDAGFAKRMQDYAIKAARESKLETSWLEPNAEYERGLTDFVGAILDSARSADFLESFDDFAGRASLIGALNGLAQLAIKATIPGVPDFYQGTELWDFSLVDPDNRRPVDFAAREAALAAISEQPDWLALRDSWQDGRIKLALTRRLLALRQQHRLLFEGGEYIPVEVEGEHKDHVLAFARRRGGELVLVAVGRHFGALTDGGREWPAANRWVASLVTRGFGPLRDWLMPERSVANDSVAIGDLFATMPVAVLVAKM